MNGMLAEGQKLVPVVSGNLLSRRLVFLDDLSPQKVLLSLVVIAILFRLAFVFTAHGIGDPNGMDTQNYLRIARNLIEGRGFTLGKEPTVFVAPLYPTLLAALQFLFGHAIWIIKIFQAAFGGVSVYLVYLLASEFFHRKVVAYVAAAIFVIHPEMIALCAFIYTEVVFIFLLLLTLLLITKALQTGEFWFFVLAGVSLGVTNLCRGTLMYFSAFLFFALLFYRDRLWWRWLSGGIAMTLVMGLTMLPWTVRNYIHFRAFIPVATGGGDVFWTGNYLPFDGEFRYEETQRKIAELTGNVSLIERDRILMAEAKKNIAAQPRQSAWLFARKTFRFWFRVYGNVPQGRAREINWLILSVLGATHFVLLALAVAGFWHANGRKPIRAMLLSLFFYYTLIHAATLAVPRYRQPLIPVLCIFAAAGLLIIRGNRYVTGQEN